MDRFKRIGAGAAVAVILGMISSPSVHAADVTGQGTTTFVATPLGSSPLADGRSIGWAHLKGVILAENTPFHLANQDCTGATIVDDKGTQLEGGGSCDGVDRDGDVWWIWWHNTPESRTWGLIDGTGKFEGIRGGGTSEVLAATVDGRLTISWEGTWTVK
jgi:hypothetical protein